MKERGFVAPGQYMQGQGVLSRMHEFTARLGKVSLVIVSAGGAKRLAGVLEENAKNAGEQVFHTAVFAGECCRAEIDRLTALAQEKHAEVIVGVGGGKVLDTAKAVAHYADLPVVIAPTTASSDAPCSALSVVYHEDGSLDTLLHLRRNPDVVLVDSAVIVTASPRLFAAGMGDAMATYYEMRACRRGDQLNHIGRKITLAAEAIAAQCAKTLFADGPLALEAVKEHVCTLAVENVIEANTLLSGLGFESGGIGAAHPINNGLAELPATHPYYHGEKVAFATICQLVLEHAPEEEVEQVLRFHTRVGLPVTLSGLGIEALSEEELSLVAAIADSDPCTHRLPVEVDAAAIAAAVKTADRLGRRYLELGRL